VSHGFPLPLPWHGDCIGIQDMKRHLIICSLVFGSWPLLGCGQKCSDIGCSAAVNIEVPLPQVEWSSIRSFSARVCRNSTCASGSFANLPATAEDGIGYGVMLAGWPSGEVMECFVYASGTFRMSLQAGQFKDGDWYTVTVTDAAGVTVASFDKAATYTRHEVGADSCGLVCTQATFN
jgi:hypothetical protein